MVRKKTCSDKGGQEMSLTLNNNETEKRNPAAVETTRESRRNLNAVAKRKRPSAAAGSAQQNVNLSDGSDEVEQPDLAGADDQRQAAMVKAITAQVLSTLEARDKPKGRKKSKKRRRISPTPVVSGTDSDDSSSSSSSSDSDSDTSSDNELDTPSSARLSCPIASQIDGKLKNKIWQNKYIDLAKLLPQTKPFTSDSISFQSTGRSQFKVTKSKQKMVLNNIEQWTTAFLRFVAIYSERFPKEIPQVIKHGELVRDLASRRTGMAWLEYDQQVRRDIEVRSIHWGEFHTEYWVMANTPRQGSFSNSDQPFRDNSKGFRARHKSRIPNGHCYMFHKKGKCAKPSCPYQHSCFQCGQSHSVLSCSNKRPNTQKASNRNQFLAK
ncbi:uncharacterized protein LOC117320063 [Pecten maximus]|uniref:uncharacterized protein LOC117320063 n=1 Tax=Pecten maximus TaxID=6579 RepID=UPI001458CF73|nr:uncharacterized protein LOC117320063 [Pecten maximus]